TLQEGAALVVTAHRREHVFATGGSKRCPFGTCVPLLPGHLPRAAHITDGAGNLSCAFPPELTTHEKAAAGAGSATASYALLSRPQFPSAIDRHRKDQQSGVLGSRSFDCVPPPARKCSCKEQPVQAAATGA